MGLDQRLEIRGAALPDVSDSRRNNSSHSEQSEILSDTWIERVSMCPCRRFTTVVAVWFDSELPLGSSVQHNFKRRTLLIDR